MINLIHIKNHPTFSLLSKFKTSHYFNRTFVL